VGEVPLEKLHDNTAVSSASIARVQAVLDRLDLVASLDRNGGLWLHHRGLVSYLYLTCFDLLGQTHRWLTFPSWLRAKCTAAEREEAIASLQVDAADHAAVAADLHDWYSERYSVRQGFIRFIRELLSVEARQQLMASILVERSVMPPSPDERQLLDDEKAKIDWLFHVRNKYTHSAAYVPGLSEADTPADLRGDTTVWLMDYSKSKTFKTTHSVQGWPHVLESAVHVGLAAFIAAIS
jgi:hypothetical protein